MDEFLEILLCHIFFQRWHSWRIFAWKQSWMVSHLKHMRPMQLFPKVLSFVLLCFWFFVNDLPWTIFISLMNINSDDTTVYGYTSKNQEDWCLIDDLFFEQVLTVQCWNNCFVTFSASKIKVVSFHYHWSDPMVYPVILSSYILNGSPGFEHLLGLMFTTYPQSIARWENGQKIISLQEISESKLYLYKSLTKNGVLQRYLG